MSEHNPTHIHRILIDWYLANGRQLPWREGRHYPTYTQWQQSLHAISREQYHLHACLNNTLQDPNTIAHNHRTTTHQSHTAQKIHSHPNATAIKNPNHTQHRGFGSERAYRVWISESMLQQTQVSRVLQHYYFQFLQQFPTLQALALASFDEVLYAWRGLGYYTRAHNLHKSAIVCLKNHEGMLPRKREELRQLFGVGEYMSGAIACFGYGESVSFMDSNMKRVLRRFFGIDSKSERMLMRLADEFLNQEESFLHNQALIDIGAILCAKKIARCNLCPLQPHCIGSKDYARYDVGRSIKREEREVLLCVFTCKGGDTLFYTQYSGKRYNNLFSIIEWRGMEGELYESFHQVCRIGRFQHAFTRYKLNITLFCIHLENAPINIANLYAPLATEPLTNAQIKTCTLQEFATKPCATLTQKALKLYENTHKEEARKIPISYRFNGT